MTRKKLYSLLIIACSVGYAWLFYSWNTEVFFESSSMEVCLIKHVSTIPCPSCGATRSVLELSEGHFTEALMINPLGLIVALILLLTPLWIIYDLIRKKSTLLRFYHWIEFRLQKPMLSIPLIFLLLLNWIWNITKGL